MKLSWLNSNKKNQIQNSEKKIAFITAIYGGYEKSCKKFIIQSIPTDFICFTDNPNIIPNGWIIDTIPYHFTNPYSLDNSNMINSLTNNKNTFNIAKYYKQAFQNIPRLKNYDVIIWLDGTIEIINPNVSSWILNNIYSHTIIGWEHEFRNGILKNEVDASDFSRYTSTICNGQPQPYQDVFKQYNSYIADGYDETYFKKHDSSRKHLGVWITCFVAFLNKNKDVSTFLDKWYEQTLKFTTQDQIGFPYVCQKLNMIPYTLPDKNIYGSPHYRTDFYIKHNHGK